ncbi:ferritin-like domain-containing protein [Hamadaea tsunoensis]|uniref:ferritin-like domain-containing protein n=1 Tax=Hamadaea tsunoensis TaxID=53368 RepID=UPI0004073F64|nr:ferritin-like domain-containing protein [Hamadaea tsunoensis]
MTSPSGSAAPSPAAELTAAGKARLATALTLEHQAIYGYGILGPFLKSGETTTARTVEAVHRARRDRLDDLLGADAPGSEAAYALPEPVADRAGALKLAALLEDGVTTAYRAALADTEGAYRKLALDAMVDAANRATAWRKVAGQTPLTLPFPGRPA